MEYIVIVLLLCMLTIDIWAMYYVRKIMKSSDDPIDENKDEHRVKPRTTNELLPHLYKYRCYLVCNNNRDQREYRLFFDFLASDYSVLSDIGSSGKALDHSGLIVRAYLGNDDIFTDITIPYPLKIDLIRLIKEDE